MKKNKSTSHNPKAFKHWINYDLLKRMAESIHRVHRDFDRRSFLALAPQLDELELKQRVQIVRDQLHAQLPKDYKTAIRILLASLKDSPLRGFDLWPYTEFVQTYGLDHRDLSLKALHQLTTLFTSEFAVRPFIKSSPEETISYLINCSRSKNVHVRRWASEGTRPRLPWGERLDSLIKSPKLALPILETLKYDEELYVRKSVANHLNDIAKDHPDFLVRLLKEWRASAPLEHQSKINWILHRALRTLIKNGHPGALRLVNADPQAKVKIRDFKIQRKDLKIGEALEFEFTLQSSSSKPQKLIIDYVVHHVKANQKTSPKVFKLKSLILNRQEKIQVSKRHHLKLITTRKYYPGAHRLEIQINGRIQAFLSWNLKT